MKYLNNKKERKIVYNTSPYSDCRKSILPIAYWWKQRCSIGKQLTDYSDFKKSYDYKGSGDWKSSVAQEAIYQDFCRSPFDTGINIDVFRTVFITVASVKCTNYTVSVYNRLGELVLKPRRAFFKFPSLAQCREHLEEALEEMEKTNEFRKTFLKMVRRRRQAFTNAVKQRTELC